MNRIVLNLEGFLDVEFYRAIFHRIFGFSPVTGKAYDELVERDNAFNICGEAHSRKSVVLKRNDLRLVLKGHDGGDSMLGRFRNLLKVIGPDMDNLKKACSIADDENFIETIGAFIYVFDRDMKGKVSDKDGEKCRTSSLCKIYFAPYPEEVILHLFEGKFSGSEEFLAFEKCKHEFEQMFRDRESYMLKRWTTLIKSLVGPGCFREMLNVLIREEDKDDILDWSWWLKGFEKEFLSS